MSQISLKVNGRSHSVEVDPKTPLLFVLTEIWEGLTNQQLCELFKDPKQNGKRNVGEILEHMSTPLVRWGWNPGEGRTPISVPESDFMANVKKWVANGAACPSSAKTSAKAGASLHR